VYIVCDLATLVLLVVISVSAARAVLPAKPRR
jgi:hypothetical protein